MYKRQTAILPFDLPRLNDKTAAQLIDLLHQLLEGIEYHYAAQIQRYQKRQREIHHAQPARTSSVNDPPF
jgi:hypothetical protein